MIMDAGVCVVYGVSSTEGSAPPPVRRTLTKKAETLYGERVVGYNRYYAAAKVGQRIDRAIRVWRDDRITVRDVCLVGGCYYQIRKVTPTRDEDGLLVTDLDLEDYDNAVRGWLDEH